jgi:hypothetical protein
MNHDKFKMTRCFYVVGMSQVGGCWSSMGFAYERYEDAMAEVENDRAKGITYTKVFTFHVYSPKEIT